MQWVMTKNTCPSCNVLVKSIRLPHESEMAFFQQSLPKLESGELDAESSPLPPVKNNEGPAADIRAKIWLFDRTDPSMYMERGAILAT